MSRKTFKRLLIAVFIIVMILSFYKLPYYVYRPGSATELKPLIEVEGAADREEGSFMLTTVSRLEPNIFIYLWAQIRPFYEIVPQEDVLEEGETQEEFDKLQFFLMDHSKYSAIHTAYEYAGIPVKNEYHGIYVLDIIEGMPAEEVLKPGDQIIKVDDLEFESSDEFASYVKDATDPITITFIREGETKTAEIETAPFPEKPDQRGFGIQLVDDYEVITDPPVEINSGSIGGPSAGLMFSLEIYNQLTEEDWTKGYEIAGTGEITEDGKVLPIGGIEHKIVAADNKGVDIFFAPSMKIKGSSNYEEAIKVKEQINSDMKIVPVESFEDAIQFLEKLEPEGE
ncbi:MAG TPA: SepM family pheromone-processing serine protease [Bacillus sp. (in: firmicutes)]|uniref:SepM family pheromone-processing serine protease n=1 Tax=Bacillus litorisediminis TaxID=2922713 RepID=UPI001FAE5D40|nr:SepM family pheromone-processing serine protease [Bacillus litorisediminis]HWO74813.1 SepM family pheromone-processing serine protease [Bacillus sp. (in: firmicutes)]